VESKETQGKGGLRENGEEESLMVVKKTKGKNRAHITGIVDKEAKTR